MTVDSTDLTPRLCSSPTLFGARSSGPAVRGRRTHWTAAALTLLASSAIAPVFADDPTKNEWVAIIDGSEAPVPDIKMGERETILKIIDEGKNRNQVMKHLEHLTKKIGTRLTGSTNLDIAGNWCAEQFKGWGLTNVTLEQWGTIASRFDRGPSSGKASVKGADGEVTTRDLQFTSYSWSAGTNGPSTGPVITMPETEEAYTAIKDQLKGAWILMPNPAEGGQRRGGIMSARYRAAIEARAKVKEEGIDPAQLAWEDRMLFDGVNGFIVSSRSDRVITSSAPNWSKLEADKVPPDIFVTICKEDYEFLEAQIPNKVEVTFDMKHTFIAGPIACHNTIAEIRGSTWPEQVVIVSGHLDSWDGPGSEGCTDNATGISTTMEAARLLMATGAKPKRTIRFICWTGEEQGLLGSKAYVDMHKDELVANVSACLVDDGGTNYDGGLPAAENMVQMLAAATAPINNVFYSETDQKHLNVNIRNTGPKLRVSGGSDHMSFNRVGIPGFFWDETGRAVYPHTHHTQFDKLDQAIPEYLVQSATCAAVTAYNLACADTLLPREAPEPAKTEQPTPNQASAPATDTNSAPAATAPATPASSTEPAKPRRPRRVSP